MALKIYELTCDSAWDGTHEITRKVFFKRTKARAQMRVVYKAELNNWEQTFGKDMVSTCVGRNTVSLHLKGNAEKKITWKVEEQ